MYLDLVYAVLLGAWGYLLPGKLFHDGEIFGFVGRFTNRVTAGSQDAMADPGSLAGYRWALWKYTYCPVCFAGAACLLRELALLAAGEPFLLFTTAPVSMLTAFTLEKVYAES